MGRLFGTDGVRGVVNEELNPELVVRLGLAIGSFFDKGSRILVAMDSRAGGELIKNIVAGALMSTGVKVYDAGLAPTPALQYAVKSNGFDGGVMVTASHNPPEYNGIKVIGSHGIEVDRDEEEAIEELYWENRFRRVSWRELSHHVEKYPLVIEEYVKAVVSHVDRDLIKSRNYRLLVDPANSVGSLTTPLIARELGVKPIVVNGTLDPLFSGRLPEPTVENLAETSKLVREVGVALGVAHDADADRVIMIDEKGVVHWGDRTAALLARYLREKGLKGRVYTAVSSSVIVEEVLRPLNIDVVWLKVGSVDIAHTMRRNGDALCGFEENGGFMYPPHQYVRDGGMTTALFLEMLATYGVPASQLFESLPKYHTVKKKYKMSRESALAVVEKVKEAFRNERLITIDGVKVVSSDYWLLVRPSGTEPLLRVMIEAKTIERLDEVSQLVDSLISEVTGR
ncbi:phosphoglucosamine mutase [Desulfurococcus mucosus]|uniref:phosphoglucosamine mutase n=1 Tax=Desulfurococcus mucosus TaxID=2275 RepID=UPI00064FB0BA